MPRLLAAAGSSQAVRMMTDAGLTDVTDLGGVSNAAEATGLPIVR